MNKLCIVTGGANGIGEGIVRRLHHDGYWVMFCDIDTNKGEALAQELSRDKQSARFMACDIKNAAEIARVVDTVAKLKLSVFALINNAGIFPRRAFLDISLQEWNDVIATNLTGAFLMGQQLIPLMLPSGDGVVVNIASGQSFRGDALGVHYTSTKHAIRGLTKSLALENSKTGASSIDHEVT